jgi:hypothetical protein
MRLKTVETDYSGLLDIIDVDDFNTDGVLVAGMVDDVRAEMIVHRVNAFDEMKAALEKAEAYMRADKSLPRGALLAVQAALRNAKAGE